MEGAKRKVNLKENESERAQKAMARRSGRWRMAAEAVQRLNEVPGSKELLRVHWEFVVGRVTISQRLVAEHARCSGKD